MMASDMMHGVIRDRASRIGKQLGQETEGVRDALRDEDREALVEAWQSLAHTASQYRSYLHRVETSLDTDTLNQSLEDSLEADVLPARLRQPYESVLDTLDEVQLSAVLEAGQGALAVLESVPDVDGSDLTDLRMLFQEKRRDFNEVLRGLLDESRLQDAYDRLDALQEVVRSQSYSDEAKAVLALMILFGIAGPDVDAAVQGLKVGEGATYWINTAIDIAFVMMPLLTVREMYRAEHESERIEKARDQLEKIRETYNVVKNS